MRQKLLVMFFATGLFLPTTSISQSLLENPNSPLNVINALDSAVVELNKSDSLQETGVTGETLVSGQANKKISDIGINAAPGGGGEDPGGDSGGIQPSSEDIFARINSEFTVSPHTAELLGESLDINNGNIMFKNTDLVIPGNGLGLDIVISRTIKNAGNTFSSHNMFADWTLDFPAIQTTLLRNSSRYSGSWGIGKECSGSLEPGPISDWGSVFESHEYWDGDNLQLPGGNGAKLLQNNGVIASSSAYPRVTQTNWKFSCFNRTDGQGEGFIGYAPNGLKYTFAQLRLISTRPIIRDFKPTSRYYAFMLATKVEDRFGNYINYNYTGNNLTSITSNDGRTVTFNYNHSRGC